MVIYSDCDVLQSNTRTCPWLSFLGMNSHERRLSTCKYRDLGTSLYLRRWCAKNATLQNHSKTWKCLIESWWFLSHDKTIKWPMCTASMRKWERSLNLSPGCYEAFLVWSLPSAAKMRNDPIEQTAKHPCSHQSEDSARERCSSARLPKH